MDQPIVKVEFTTGELKSFNRLMMAIIRVVEKDMTPEDFDCFMIEHEKEIKSIVDKIDIGLNTTLKAKTQDLFGKAIAELLNGAQDQKPGFIGGIKIEDGKVSHMKPNEIPDEIKARLMKENKATPDVPSPISLKREPAVEEKKLHGITESMFKKYKPYAKYKYSITTMMQLTELPISKVALIKEKYKELNKFFG